MREFNTSGPNIPSQHYTLERKELIEKGDKLVDNINGIKITTYLVKYDNDKW